MYTFIYKETPTTSDLNNSSQSYLPMNANISEEASRLDELDKTTTGFANSNSNDFMGDVMEPIVTPTSASMTSNSSKSSNNFHSIIDPVTIDEDDFDLPVSTELSLFSVLYEMSEDHKVSLKREYNRISQLIPAECKSSPIYLRKLCLPGQARAVRGNRFQEATIAWLTDAISSEAPEKALAARQFMQNLFDEAAVNNFLSATQLRAIHVKITDPSYRGFDFAKADGIKIFRENSFIAHRKTSTGELGPLALFSRHNTSIILTRSLGDRYGPRSCCGVPEITEVTIPMGKHARFVLATDGVWDVITKEMVRRTALQPRFANPSEYSTYLALKAQQLRFNAQIKTDDITVIVVDINAAAFDEVAPKGNIKSFASNIFSFFTKK